MRGLAWGTKTETANSGQAEQNPLSSCLPSKNFKIKIHKTIILPVVLYWCGTWSLMLTEEQTLNVVENTVLRRTFGRKWETREDCKMRSFITRRLHHILLG
jgi:hypothetical protein